MRRARRWAAAAIAGSTGLSAPAHAGIEDTVGLGPEDVALGGSLAARPGSLATVYHNPAGLAPEAGPEGEPDGFGELHVSYVYAHPVVYAQRLDGPELPLITEPMEVSGFLLGTRFDLGAPFGLSGLALGAAFYLPTTGIFRWSIHPDDKPQWLFLTDRSQPIGIHLGLAYRPWPWLSVGAGLRALFDVETFTTGRVVEVESGTDPQTGESVFDVRTQLGEQVTVYGRYAPNVGVLITPIEELRIGLVYRGKLFVDDWGWTRIQGVPASPDLGYVHRFAHYFQPHQAVLALSGRLHEQLWLSADLTFGHWSEALTTYHSELGPGRFGDTWTPAFGVEWRPTRRLRVYGGYRYVPSPFDNFGGPTNLLDGDQHVVSTGLSVQLFEPSEELPLGLAATGAVRTAWLVEREEHKDPRRFASDRSFLTNPGLHPYRYGGAVPGFSVGVEVQW